MSWQRWQRYSAAILGASFGCLIHPYTRALEWPPGPPDLGAPSKTHAGAIRSYDCNLDSVPPLSSIAPNETTLTASARPTLYIYVPPMDNVKAQIGFFDVQAQEILGEIKDIDIPTSPGILPVSLPEGTVLEPGRLYNWAFIVYCNADNQDYGEVVEGNLIRVEESAADASLPDTALDRARWYLQQHLWHETVEELVKVRSRYPDEWRELLKSIGLPHIHAKPLLGDRLEVSEGNAWWLPSATTSRSDRSFVEPKQLPVASPAIESAIESSTESGN